MLAREPSHGEEMSEMSEEKIEVGSKSRISEKMSTKRSTSVKMEPESSSKSSIELETKNVCLLAVFQLLRCSPGGEFMEASEESPEFHPESGLILHSLFSLVSLPSSLEYVRIFWLSDEIRPRFAQGSPSAIPISVLTFNFRRGQDEDSEALPARRCSVLANFPLGEIRLDERVPEEGDVAVMIFNLAAVTLSFSSKFSVLV